MQCADNQISQQPQHSQPLNAYYTSSMSTNTSTALLYHTYNSLFLSLPFKGIEAAGTHLALFAQYCKNGFDAGKRPDEIVEGFWNEYFENASPKERHDLLFYFIQYVERQVVLFDSVEDALFAKSTK